jgi:hypothetical protein
VLRRDGIARLAERVADRLIRVEVHVPAAVLRGVGPHGEDRTGHRERQHLDVGRRVGEDVREATPIARPPAAIRAAKVVVSTPKKPRIAMISAMFRSTPIVFEA